MLFRNIISAEIRPTKKTLTILLTHPDALRWWDLSSAPASASRPSARWPSTFCTAETDWTRSGPSSGRPESTRSGPASLAATCSSAAHPSRSSSIRWSWRVSSDWSPATWRDRVCNESLSSSRSQGSGPKGQ